MSNAGMLGVARCITGMSCPSRIGRAYGVICTGLKTEAAPYDGVNVTVNSALLA